MSSGTSQTDADVREPGTTGIPMGDREVPPVGEELHLPGPSLIPLFSAVGITLIVVGTTISLILSVVGLIIFLITTVRWIRDTRRDIDELPEEHAVH